MWGVRLVRSSREAAATKSRWIRRPRTPVLIAVVVGLAAAFVGVSTAQAASWAARSTYPTGTNPGAIVVADLNKDGQPDLVTANSGNGTVSVLLGTGSGNFATKTDYDAVGSAVGAMPSSIAVGDLNGDGNLDLAVTDEMSPPITPGTVAILFGDGAGHFSAPTSLAANGAPDDVAIGDLNGDARPDLAVSNGRGNLSLYFANNSGGFDAKVDLPGFTYSGVAIADFNHDGHPDLAATQFDNNFVSLFLGDGTGNFGAPTNTTVGNGPNAIHAADVNGDGVPDLVVGDTFDSNSSVLLNDGAGAFASPVSLTAAADARSVVDLNNDGKIDLVAGGPDNTVAVLLGTGAGEFSAARYFGAGGGGPVAVADFNADGKPDIAVAHVSASTVTILLQQQPVTVGGVAAPVDLAGLPARSSATGHARSLYGDVGFAALALAAMAVGAACSARRTPASAGSALALAAMAVGAAWAVRRRLFAHRR